MCELHTLMVLSSDKIALVKGQKTAACIEGRGHLSLRFSLCLLCLIASTMLFGLKQLFGYRLSKQRCHVKLTLHCQITDTVTSPETKNKNIQLLPFSC